MMYKAPKKASWLLYINAGHAKKGADNGSGSLKYLQKADGLTGEKWGQTRVKEFHQKGCPVGH